MTAGNRFGDAVPSPSPDTPPERLRADMERLAEIGERVLAGESIDNFNLGRYERHVVIGYVQEGLGEGVADAYPDA